MCLTSPAIVTRVEERGGITVVSVRSEDEGVRECITYVHEVEPGDRVLIAGGAIVERLAAQEPVPPASLGALLIEAFDASHTPGRMP